MGKPHVVAIPYPAQGHVIPLMELAQCLAKNGIKVTFINTESNHKRVKKSLPHTEDINELISLVSLPDGLESEEDRNNHGKLAEATMKIMPGKLQNLIEKMNETESERVTCVLADVYMANSMKVAEKFGIKKAAFLPAATATLALTLSAEKLIDDGIVDSNGTPLKKELFQLSPSMPKMSPMFLSWACFPDIPTQKMIFDAVMENNKSSKSAERLVCNSSYELEADALAFIPNCTPIGPLLASNRLGKSTGYFWSEDSTCLSWLDEQPTNSVIYVAFGSFTVFDPTQFQELALGLEATNRPFLWVVRQDITQDIDTAYPAGFKERVNNRGKIVDWAPQQQVLFHPSVACFVSHCGWNSTVEGISNGVPILCWPYFADQFLNQGYIVDQWKVGLSLELDGNGIITQEEIKKKVEELLTDESFKTRTLELQAKAAASVGEGGSSRKNFNDFIDWITEN